MRGMVTLLRQCSLSSIVMRVGKLPESQLNEKAAPRLRIIARNGTGVDMIHKDTCIRRGIVVTNQPGGNAQAVAEVCRFALGRAPFADPFAIARIDPDSHPSASSRRGESAPSSRRTCTLHLGPCAGTLRQGRRPGRHGRYRVRTGKDARGESRDLSTERQANLSRCSTASIARSSSTPQHRQKQSGRHPAQTPHMSPYPIREPPPSRNSCRKSTFSPCTAPCCRKPST